MDAIPDIKTANKVEELILKNAGLAVGGLWQADDDSIVNLDNLILKPGAVIMKASGSKGLEPVQSSRNFDISQFVLGDMNEKTTKKIVGNALPDVKSGIRSAYEWQVRKSEATESEVPVVLRIAQANDALFDALYGIITSPDMMGSPYYVAPFEMDEGEKKVVVRAKSANPLIRLQKQVDAQASYQALAGAIQLFGPGVLGLVDQELFAKDYLEDNGLDPKYFKKGGKIETPMPEGGQGVDAAKILEGIQGGQ